MPPTPPRSARSCAPSAAHASATRHGARARTPATSGARLARALGLPLETEPDGSVSVSLGAAPPRASPPLLARDRARARGCDAECRPAPAQRAPARRRPRRAAAAARRPSLDDIYEHVVERLRRDLLVERERMGDLIGGCRERARRRRVDVELPSGSQPPAAAATAAPPRRRSRHAARATADAKGSHATPDPVGELRFQVSLGDVAGKEIGWFTECTGLAVEWEVYTYEEGGQNDFAHKFRGRAKYPNLVLKRGVTYEDALLALVPAVQQDHAERKDITRQAARPRRQAGAQLAVPGARSRSSGRGPALNASSTNAATETLEIAHHGFKESD